MPTTRELEERETIKEIMGAWEKYRALWVERFGNDEGFVDWFTETLSSVRFGCAWLLFFSSQGLKRKSMARSASGF